MKSNYHEHAYPEERKVTGWRSDRRRGGRILWGLLLAGIGGFWLTTNLTDNMALIAQNPGRIVLPALVILLGIIAMGTKREPRRTDVE